jgi:hypothetical protein
MIIVASSCCQTNWATTIITKCEEYHHLWKGYAGAYDVHLPHWQLSSSSILVLHVAVCFAGLSTCCGLGGSAGFTRLLSISESGQLLSRGQQVTMITHQSFSEHHWCSRRATTFCHPSRGGCVVLEGWEPPLRVDMCILSRMGPAQRPTEPTVCNSTCCHSVLAVANLVDLRVFYQIMRPVGPAGLHLHVATVALCHGGGS